MPGFRDAKPGNIPFFCVHKMGLKKTRGMQAKKTKSVDRREQILKTAARLFRKMGYNATTMRLIAADAGMEASSLYNHISSKQEILDELLFSIADLFMAGMKEAQKLEENPFRKLEHLVDLHVKITLMWPDRIALITGDWMHLEEPRLKEYISLRSDYESRFRQIISEGMEAGILENIDIDIALFSILSSLHWLYSWSGKHQVRDEESLRKEMKQCLLNGLKKQPTIHQK